MATMAGRTTKVKRKSKFAVLLAPSHRKIKIARLDNIIGSFPGKTPPCGQREPIPQSFTAIWIKEKNTETVVFAVSRGLVELVQTQACNVCIANVHQ